MTSCNQNRATRRRKLGAGESTIAVSKGNLSAGERVSWLLWFLTSAVSSRAKFFKLVGNTVGWNVRLPFANMKGVAEFTPRDSVYRRHGSVL
jgi:hypothetical protein